MRINAICRTDKFIQDSCKLILFHSSFIHAFINYYDVYVFIDLTEVLETVFNANVYFNLWKFKMNDILHIV